jgi:GNAT superfamily N-acetyltransferase
MGVVVGLAFLFGFGEFGFGSSRAGPSRWAVSCSRTAVIIRAGPAHRPTAGALTGRIELRLDNSPVGIATMTCCPACRTAVLDNVHVTAEYRRLGYGRALIAAARVRMPGYTWTTPMPNGGSAQAF